MRIDDEEVLFAHELLDMYRVGRQLNREITQILSELPRGAGEAGDNLGRAGASITRNIAEANGKRTAADKAARLYIVRGSGMEVGAAIDELVDRRFIPAERGSRARVLASRIVAMVMGRIRTLEETEPSSSLGSLPEAPGRAPHSEP